MTTRTNLQTDLGKLSSWVVSVYLRYLFNSIPLIYSVLFPLASNCMKICIQNMHKISEDIPAHVLAGVAVSVFSFVKESYPVSPALFEEFENNDGYGIFQAILLR